MKLTKLFLTAVLAVCAMAFVACEPDTPNTPKEYALELTSDAVMEFPAEGGEGVIEWALNEVTRYEPVPEALPTFYTEAEWIALDAENLGAFAVAANEGEAREAVINIEYKEQKFAVTVKQAAVTVDDPKVAFAAAARIPSAELGLENNIFVLTFVDDAENTELNIVLVGDEGDEILKTGTYSAENGGFSVEENLLVYYDTNEELSFVDGEVVVAVDGENYDFDMTLVAEDGSEFIFIYTGPVLDMVPEVVPVEPVAFAPVSVKAERYMIGNFFLQLYIDDTRYHELDMYDEVTPNDDMLSAGVYSYTAETISTWSVFSTGNDQTCALADAEITLAHNEDNTTTITGYIKSEQGDYITIEWTGVVEGFVYEKETGLTFDVEALSAAVHYDEEGQKDIIFMVDEFAGHVISFKGEDLLPSKPLADGDYSSEDGSIDIAYCVHGYGDGYGDMTSAKATVVNDLEAGTTSFDIEWEFEGNTYKLRWDGAVEGIIYKEVVELLPLDFKPVYVEMVRMSSKDRYFYFYDSEENELVCELYNDKIILPYINYEGTKLEISTEDYIFEFDDRGLNKDDGVRGYNVRFVTLDGHLIEFAADLETYVNY
ncbi:MAG: BACON domain-containing protein [Alistipes sp.]|nr:BACON domain-containing protein [Alistipes sp.]